jgi:hypothetical protein
MIEQLRTFQNNVLAIEVIDGFTKTDEKICQKFFQEKLDQGFSTINILVKLDELKVSKSSIKAFIDDTIWTLKNYKRIGHLAIVAHSSILKALLPVDKLFFDNESEDRQERYFDISEIEDAYNFVNPSGENES